MTFFNTGTLYASKPFDENALAAIESVLGKIESEWLKVQEASITFQEFPSGTLDMKIDELVDQLGMVDIQIEGRIDYDGSYEGAYFWKHGEYHVEKTQAEVAIIDAGTEELIAELESRGYHAFPAQEQTHAEPEMM